MNKEDKETISDFKLASDYDTLLKQARAMKIMIHALEQQRQFSNVSISNLTRQIALSGQNELDAERQINHLLTEEVEHLQSRVEGLEEDARVRRRSDESHLAECPFCSSLDIGGSMNKVYCYGCGAEIQKEPPLQNAIDAWNTRKGKQLNQQEVKSDG